jgi:hypothetical protein
MGPASSIFLLSEICVSRGVAALEFYLTAHHLIQVAPKYHLLLITCHSTPVMTPR